MKLFGNHLGGKKVLLVTLLILLIIAIYILMGSLVKQESKLDTDELEKKIISLGELSTIEYHYKNLLRFKDSKELRGIKLPLTTKSLFILYEGYIKAGVDLKDMTIEAYSENKIILHLRNANFTNNVIKENSIKVYDEKSGLFNPLKLEEVFQLLEGDKKKLEQAIKEEGFLEQANEKAENLISSLLVEMGFEDITFKFY